MCAPWSVHGHSLSVAGQKEGQPGWAVPVPWALCAAWHQPCLPQQMWDPEDALPWHLLLQPEESRTRLLQCLPWRLPGCAGQGCGIGLQLEQIGLFWDVRERCW